MTAPVVQKTYQFDVGTAITSGATPLTQQKTRLRSAKNKLIGFASSPWTPYYSCNGSVAGAPGDGVDRWASDGDLVWATAESIAHSWMVLRQPGLYGIQLLLSLVTSANGDGLTAMLSLSSGFTGGSKTARPTAVDEIALATGTDTTLTSRTYKGWNPLPANGVKDILQVLQSTDGRVTRLAWCANSTTPAAWGFEEPLHPEAYWTNPVLAYLKSTGTNNTASMTYTRRTCPTADANCFVRSSVGGVPCELVFSTELARSAPVVSGMPNAFSGEYPTGQLGLVSSTPGARGVHGQVYDQWEAQGYPNGTYAPSGGSKQITSFGGLFYPWNGSTAVNS
jgi:hypothetical protein